MMMVSKATLVELQDISHLEITCRNPCCASVELVPIKGKGLFPMDCRQCGTPFFPTMAYGQIMEGKLLTALRVIMGREAKEPSLFNLRLRVPAD